MLRHSPYYHSTIKNITSAFGTIFSDMEIIRTVAGTSKTIKVPLTFASKDKAFVRKTVDPSMNYNMGRVFPALAFQFLGMQFDTSRMLNATQYTAAGPEKMYTPVPYNLEFELYIGSANIEDGLQVLEQILPFFTPAYTITTKDWPTLNIKKDVPIVLNSVNFSDNTPDSDFSDDRILEWTLSFTAKAYFYGPSVAAKQIKEVKNFIYDSGLTNLQETVDIVVNPRNAVPTDVYTIDTTITSNV